MWERGDGCLFWDVTITCLLVRVFDVQYLYRHLDMGWSVVGLGRLFNRPSNLNYQYLLTTTFDFEDIL